LKGICKWNSPRDHCEYLVIKGHLLAALTEGLPQALRNREMRRNQSPVEIDESNAE
jgi:hypothetical protein